MKKEDCKLRLLVKCGGYVLWVLSMKVSGFIGILLIDIWKIIGFRARFILAKAIVLAGA